ncbi:hypothetical protein Tco_0923740 [Tanacetum coccineum]|uniref:Uncharacterized protein n=1 Tax=Tanacetum coccineum TaxID=301880 RepID=A0ABQ5D1T9_9ASTR
MSCKTKRELNIQSVWNGNEVNAVRHKLTTAVENEAVNEEMDDSLVRAATTASSLEVEQDSGVNTPQSDEDSMKFKELMEFYTKLQQRVLDLENTKTAQAREITSDQEDASKHERKIDDVDKDAEITLVDETQGSYGDDLMFDTGVLDDEEVFAGQEMAVKEVNVTEKEVSTADPVTTAGEVVTTTSVAICNAKPTKTTINDDLTLAQIIPRELVQVFLMMKSCFQHRRWMEEEVMVAEKEVSTADPVTTAGEVVTTTSVAICNAKPTKTTINDDLTLAQTLIDIRSAKPKGKRVMIGEQNESTTRTRPQQLPLKDKGKAIMEEPEKPTKRKDQIRNDEEVAQRLQAQLQAKLEEEDRLVRQREEEANIISWDNVQAMIDIDYQIAQ